MARVLRSLALLMGVACVAIGLWHLTCGTASVPGEGGLHGRALATVDGRERFYAAIFTGYGAAWVWAARQRPVPTAVVRWLTGFFLLGGLGRLVAVAEHGWPQWLQVAETVLEVGLPPLLWWLAPADEREAGLRAPAASTADARSGPPAR